MSSPYAPSLATLIIIAIITILCWQFIVMAVKYVVSGLDLAVLFMKPPEKSGFFYTLWNTLHPLYTWSSQVLKNEIALAALITISMIDLAFQIKRATIY